MKTIRYGPSDSQCLDLYLPEREQFDVFVYFHGGGLTGGDKVEASVFAEYLQSRGIAVISANYRMYPEVVFPQFLEDAALVVRWAFDNMKNYGACRRFFVGGSSACGYISMMLCFDAGYLQARGVDPTQISGYVHDAGQPTAHFTVLKERGLDSRRIIVDETAPMYYVGLSDTYPPMEFVLSENDIPCRYEQTMLMLAALKHFGCDPRQIHLDILPGCHFEYVRQTDEAGSSVFGKLIERFMEKCS